MNSCFFIGHHDAPYSLQEKLNETVEYLVRYRGVTQFTVGAYGNFDSMATSAVQRIKRKYPDLYAYRLIVYPPVDKKPILPEFFDHLYYPLELFDVPQRFAIPKANRLLVDKSDFLVSYVHRDGGNSGKIMRHAKVLEKKGFLTILNLDK